MGRKRKPRPRRATVVRYELADGTRCTKETPGAVRRVTKTDMYYYEPPRRAGEKKPPRVPLDTDEAVAWKKLRDILADEYRRELGIVDDATRHALRPIDDHLAEWLRAVADDGASADRVECLRTRLTLLIETAGWKRITDVRRPNCSAALQALQQRKDLGRGGEGMSAQTRNHYLSHARQFTRWLHREGRLSPDPLAGAKKVNTATDRRHDRRAPEDEEIAVLFAHLGGAWPDFPPPVRCDMSGPHRALAYEVSMCTGLRAGELRALVPAGIDLDGGRVELPARLAKKRKRAVQPLPRWLCDKLRAWLQAGGRLFDGFPEKFPGRLLQADLLLARNGWIARADSEEERQRREASNVCRYEVTTVHGPLYWDFHALRHWYLTALGGQGGISPAVLQELARHSDPRLTLDTYSHPRDKDKRRAVDRLRPGQAPPGE